MIKIPKVLQYWPLVSAYEVAFTLEVIGSRCWLELDTEAQKTLYWLWCHNSFNV